MRGINSDILVCNELPVTFFILMDDGRLLQRCTGIRSPKEGVFEGHLTRNKKLMGRWVWDMNRFEQPVFYSALRNYPNGNPRYLTKGPLIHALKKLVMAVIDSKKVEIKTDTRKEEKETEIAA